MKSGAGPRHGLVIGKFMPLHSGHVDLIRYAANRCDDLTVLLGARKDEPIPGPVRLGWLWETFRGDGRVRIEYTDLDLPDAPESDREVSRAWASYLSGRFPLANVIFSSEKYGEYLAEYMGIGHEAYDPARGRNPVSGSAVRADPLGRWDDLPAAVRPYYLKKVCVYGPESTGKSVLTEKLAARFGTVFVPEVARDLIDAEGNTLTWEIMERIGPAHALEILKAEKSASRLLFVDTDVTTSRLFARHFFGKEPVYPPWVDAANRFDLYLFCEMDTPYVPDPQRESEEFRARFRQELMGELEKKGTPYHIVRGGWEERTERAARLVESHFGYHHRTA